MVQIQAVSGVKLIVSKWRSRKYGSSYQFSCHCDCGTSDFVILYPDRAAGTGTGVVVERLGAYLETWSVGVHFKVPFIDRVAKESF